MEDDKIFYIKEEVFDDERDSDSEHENENGQITLDDELVFKNGELFDNYELFMERLDAHSKQSSVQYWRRDSRTVKGAFTKTNRHLNPKLVYYSLKYACIFGGQKFSSRSNGCRTAFSLRTNCPAHVHIRANKTGQKLEVVSVCNTHNHPISDDVHKNLPQNRRISSTLKQEILDLLLIGINRKWIMKYIKAQCDQVVTYKDLINMSSTDKRSAKLSPARMRALLKKIKDFDQNEYNVFVLSNKKKFNIDYSDIEDSTNSTFESLKSANNNEFDEKPPLISSTTLVESKHLESMQYNDSLMDPIGREVEIWYTEDSITDPNIDGTSYVYSESDTMISDSTENCNIENEIIIGDMNVNFKSEFLSSDKSPQTLNQLATDSSVQEIFVKSSDQMNSSCKVEIMEDCEMLINSQDSEALYHNIVDNENCVQLFSETMSKTDDFSNVIYIQNTDEDIKGMPVQMLEVYEDNELNSVSPIKNIKTENLNSTSDMFMKEEKNQSFEPVETKTKDETRCLSCGKTGEEMRDVIENLVKKKDRLIRENRKLALKRDRMRRDIMNMRSLRQPNKISNHNINSDCKD